MRKFNIAQRRYVGAKTRLLDSINRIFQTHIFKDLESRNCAEIKIKDLESKDYGEGKGEIQIKDLESKDFSLGEIEIKHNSAKQSDKINKKNFSENSEITKDSNESKTYKDSKNFKLIESGEFRATKNESESCKESKLIESNQTIDSKTELNRIFQTHIFKDLESAITESGAINIESSEFKATKK